MNKIRLMVLLATLSVSVACASALNLMNYATHPGGDMDYKLFPEENGFVYLCDTILTTRDRDDVLDGIESYMMTVNSSQGSEVENVSVSRRRYSADVELGFGQRVLNFEVWGSPVARIATNASKLKFNLSALAKDSMVVITYSNFETNRTRIPGEGKNDGDPNIIHWQRVNALRNEKKEFEGKNDRDSREELYDKECMIAFEHYLYANEANEFYTLVEDLRKVVGEDKDLNYRITPVNAINAETKTYSDVDIDKYQGCLLAKGNNVFVTSGLKDHEVAGATELARQIILDGFWNVVPEARYAHFIIEYNVDTDGRDKGYIVIKDAKGNNPISGFSGSKTGASESDWENRDAARTIYKKALKKIQKQVMNNELPPEFSAYCK